LKLVLVKEYKDKKSSKRHNNVEKNIVSNGVARGSNAML